MLNSPLAGTRLARGGNRAGSSPKLWAWGRGVRPSGPNGEHRAGARLRTPGQQVSVRAPRASPRGAQGRQRSGPT